MAPPKHLHRLPSGKIVLTESELQHHIGPRVDTRADTGLQISPTKSPWDCPLNTLLNKRTWLRRVDSTVAIDTNNESRTGCPVIGAEVIHAVRHEMASTVADFAVRRVALSWRYPWTMAAAAPEIGRLMAAERGWDRAQTDSQISALVQSAAPADEPVAHPSAAGRSAL